MSGLPGHARGLSFLLEALVLDELVLSGVDIRRNDDSDSVSKKEDGRLFGTSLSTR